MVLLLLAFLGGALTIISPCILPVLPFVFARQGRSSGPNGKPVRFRVALDGRAPEDSHGVDINSNGEGVVREQRLYQLIRQTGQVTDGTFTIEFLDPGVQAWSFTFG